MRYRSILIYLLLLLLPAVSSAASDDIEPPYRGLFFEDHPQILTDPMLTGPSSDGVTVVWYSESPSARHEVVYGEALEHRTPATTTAMSQMFEDADSQVSGRSVPTFRPGEKISKRRIYRHAARIAGLKPNRRVPYYAVTHFEGETFRSRTFTLQPLPSPDRPVKLLLTSDHQNRSMAPANLQKVVETVGHVDAVLFAGDFVDTPNRASEWFDRNDPSRPAFFPSMQGRLQQLFPDHPYRGGEILQHAPVFATIGNHESPGRFDLGKDLDTQDNDPRPRWYAAWQWEQLDDAQRKATGLTRDAFIRARSFDHVTYYEMWDMPHNEVPGEDPENYYMLRYGNVALVSLNVSRVWRHWDDGFANDRPGKFAEPAETINDLNSWGFGDIFFGDFSPGSAQREWLKQQLATQTLRSAAVRVVLAHQSMFGHGDNAVPVLADPEATIHFRDDRPPLVTRFPTDTTTWSAVVQAAKDEAIDSVRYSYPIEADLWLGVERDLLEAGVELVHSGHSHVWNRSYVDDPGNEHRLRYLETSNVGNSFGPTPAFEPRASWARQFYPDSTMNVTRDPAFWPPGDYPRRGDPHGRPVVPPSGVARAIDVMKNEGGARNLPFISSNQTTVFSILDSAEGTVRSYAHDTRQPQAPAVEVDCFALSADSRTDPCSRKAPPGALPKPED